jgi:hypothetical protein
MQDDRFDAGLNATLDTGFVMFMFMILFTIFVPAPGIRVITKQDVAHQRTVPPATVGLCA